MAAADGRREGEAGAHHLGEEGDRGNFEEEKRIARTKQKAARMLPGRGDGVGGGERLHAAPLVREASPYRDIRGAVSRSSCKAGCVLSRPSCGVSWTVVGCSRPRGPKGTAAVAEGSAWSAQAIRREADNA